MRCCHGHGLNPKFDNQNISLIVSVPILVNRCRESLREMPWLSLLFQLALYRKDVRNYSREPLNHTELDVSDATILIPHLILSLGLPQFCHLTPLLMFITMRLGKNRGPSRGVCTYVWFSIFIPNPPLILKLFRIPFINIFKSHSRWDIFIPHPAIQCPLIPYPAFKPLFGPLH